MFKYKNFIGKAVFDKDEKTFIGNVINMVKDGITFSGKTIEEVRGDFYEAVDDYLAWAKEENFELRFVGPPPVLYPDINKDNKC